MLDGASMDFAWTVGAVVGAILFGVASLSSIRALDSLYTLIREKRPDKWTDPGPTAQLNGPFLPQWISRVVLGLDRLDILMTIIMPCYGPRGSA